MSVLCCACWGLCYVVCAVVGVMGCVCCVVSVFSGGGGLTYTQDVEAEPLARGLVDQLMGEAVETHVTRQRQGAGALLLAAPISDVTG